MLNKLNEFYEKVEGIYTDKTLDYSQEMHYLANLFLAWFNYNKEEFIRAYPKEINRLTIGQCRSKAILARPYLLKDDFDEEVLLWQLLVKGMAHYDLNSAGKLIIRIDKCCAALLAFGFYRQYLNENVIYGIALLLFDYYGCETVIEEPIEAAATSDKKLKNGIYNGWNISSKISGFWRQKKNSSAMTNKPTSVGFNAKLSCKWLMAQSQGQPVNEIEYSTDEDSIRDAGSSKQPVSSTSSSNDCGCCIQ